jgi:DNA-directed RNA polymerase alpha subunit
MDINNLKHTYRKALKATVETTKKTLEAIDVDKLAKHVDETKKKIETKLGTYQADLEELLKKQATDSAQPKTEEDNTHYQHDIFERSVDDLDVSASIKEALVNAGINTVNELHAMRDEDILDIKGIDKEALDAIKKSMS